MTFRRVYERPSFADGKRVLVDRVLPPDISRDDARLDEWLSDVAPSTELQRWYGHDPFRFAEFRRRYLAELDDPAHRSAASRLIDLTDDGELTLLTAAEDADHSPAAVLAEWLTGADRSEPDPPAPPPPSGYRAAVSAKITNLNPGAFAFVMGTGIVSTALNADGAHTASLALLVVGLAGCAVLLPAYAWRLLRRRERFVADLVGPRAFAFLTISIAANVIAARMVADGHTSVAGGFLAFGAVGWLLLGYGIPLGLIASTRRDASFDQVNGTWFLWAVGSQSVAVAAAGLARLTSSHQLQVLALVCWGIGLMQYLLTAAIVLARLLARPVAPGNLMTSSWICMGAAAISVLAGTRLLALPAGSMLLSRSVVAGSSVVLWSFASWLIPLLLALGVWRHVLRKVPFRYELGWWNLVFPIGMYAVTTHELGRATGTSWMTTLGRWEIWVAGVVWVLVIAAMGAAAVRPHLTTGRAAGPNRRVA
ncbi:SLAC1 family transporter [Streptomyces sp. NPDC002767]